MGLTETFAFICNVFPFQSAKAGTYFANNYFITNDILLNTSDPRQDELEGINGLEPYSSLNGLISCGCKGQFSEVQSLVSNCSEHESQLWITLFHVQKLVSLQMYKCLRVQICLFLNNFFSFDRITGSDHKSMNCFLESWWTLTTIGLPGGRYHQTHFISFIPNPSCIPSLVKWVSWWLRVHAVRGYWTED